MMSRGKGQYQPSGKDWSKEIELVDASEFHGSFEKEVGFRLKRAAKKCRGWFFSSNMTTIKTLSIILTLYPAYSFQCLEVWLMATTLLLVLGGLSPRDKKTLKNGENQGRGNAGGSRGSSARQPLSASRAPPGKRALGRAEPLPVDPFEDMSLEEVAETYFYKQGKYCNKECYCGSLQKYKKCCFPLDQKFGPRNQERKEPSRG